MSLFANSLPNVYVYLSWKLLLGNKKANLTGWESFMAYKNEYYDDGKCDGNECYSFEK